MNPNPETEKSLAETRSSRISCFSRTALSAVRENKILSALSAPPREILPLLLLLSFFLLPSSFCLSAPTTPADFKFRRTLLPPTSASSSQLATIELDEPIFAETADPISDLRLFDRANTETPLVIRPHRRESQAEREVDIGFVQDGFRILPGNHLEFTLHRTNALDTPIAVAFDTPLDNFEKQVRIDGSPDGTNWVLLIEHQPVFDYARFMDVRNLRVNLPPSAHAFFRIELSNISEAQQSPLSHMERDQRAGTVFSEVERQTFTRADFRIDRVRLIGRHTFADKQELIQRAYPLADIAIKTDAEKRVTIVNFTAGRAPITEISLEATTPNFSRTVTVEGANTPGDWATLASDTISRIRIAGFQQDDLTITLPHATRHRLLRLTIHNLDSPPLVLDRLHARGETHEAIFFHDSAQAYRLYYGGTDIPAPRYDVSDVLLASDATGAASYTLAAAEPNPAYQSGRHTGGWWNSRGFLIAAVIAMVAALAWTLARAAKQISP